MNSATKKLYPEGYSNKFHRFLLWLKLHPPRSGEAFLCVIHRQVLLTQTFKRTSPSSRNKHPSDIAERHSANTATALCGILTRLPFSPITIG